MFKDYKIINDGKEDLLYLFIDNYFEFAKELNSNKNYKESTIREKVINYIKTRRINFKGNKVFLVVNGIIISMLLIGSLTFIHDYDLIKNHNQYFEYISLNTIDLSLANNSTKFDVEIINDEDFLSNESTTIKNETNQLDKVTKSSPTSTKIVNGPKLKNETMVTIYRANGTIITLELEEYLIGVIGAEMPASFNIEALKAQAIASRTYALKRINEGKILTDTVSTQSYKDNNQLKAIWGSDYNKYYSKIQDVVNITKEKYISYNNYYIDAIYHSTNNGYTEDPINVWGYSIPYLKSVSSPWDKSATSYLQTVFKDITSVNNALGSFITNESSINVISRTTNGSINYIEINGIVYNGKTLRETLGLRSTDFDIAFEYDNIIFVTRGYGHQVGMSQYGANGMAKEGYTYAEILNHYYPNTIIKAN